MIRTENLTRIFRTEEVETIALNGVNIEVEDGEFIAIMGPSGCGKSTLLNILGLLDSPTEGKYWLNNEEVGHLKERERTAYRKGRIGFVFQNFNLIDELTVEENVDLQLKYLGVGKAERKERVLEILRKVKLSHRAKHYPHQLSGGEQRRLSLLRAIAVEPDYLIMDEVTSGLDLISADAVLTLVENFVKLSGSSCIFITHSRKDAMRIANRIIIMREGRIAEQGYLIDQLSNKKGQG